MANDDATTGIDTIVQDGSDSTLTISAPDQINEGDSFDGGGGANTIIVSEGANNAYLFFLASFHNYSAISILGSAPTGVWLDASQFGTGLVSLSLAVSGVDGVGTNLSILNAPSFDASGFAFTNWQHTADFQTDHRLFIGGDDGNNTLIGNDATSNDLDGGRGDDVLNGAALDDALTGELGQDTLTGHGGADTFYFLSKKESPKGAGRDVITDFSGVNGGEHDLIDLSFMDAKAGVHGNQHFKFIGAHKFHHRAGELQVKYNDISHIGIVAGDTNGDGKADFQIEVHSLTALVVGDFVL